MIIKELQIFGYGKWLNVEFQLNDQIQLFYGKNESGKSTLQSFIRSILFGFPNKRKKINPENRYEPKHSDKYGGRILLSQTRCGDIWLERTDKALQVTNIQGDILPNETLDKILGGLDETLFDSFYGFKLSNLQDLANVGADQLNDYFLSIGTLGSDKFLQIAKNLDKESETIFKGKGKNPPLNQLLEEYEELETRYQNLKENMVRYDSLVSQRDEIDKIIEVTNEQIRFYEEKVQKTDQIIHYYESYLELLGIQQELSHLSYTEIPDKANEQIGESENLIANLQEDNIALEEKINHINHDLSQLTRLHWARNKQEERVNWLSLTEEAQDIQRQITYKQDQIFQQEKTMEAIAARNAMEPERMLSLDEFQDQENLLIDYQNNWGIQLDQLDILVAEKNYLMNQRLNFQSRSAGLRQEVTLLESQRMNDEELLIQNTKLTSYLPSLIVAVLGLITSFLNQWFISLPGYFNIIGIIILLVGLIMLARVMFRHRTLIYEFNNSPLIDQILDLKDDETYVYEQSQDLAIAINEAEFQENQMRNDISNLAEERQEFLYNLGFKEEADIDIILKTQPYQEYYQAMDYKTELEEEVSKLHLVIENWRQQLSPMFERFPISKHGTDEEISHILAIEKSLQEVMNRADSLENRRKEMQKILEKNQSRIVDHLDKIGEIFKQVGVHDRLEFNQRLETNRQIDRLQTKEKMYQNHLQDFMEQLVQIENRQSLDIELHAHQRSLALEKSKLEPNLRQRANLTVEISRLEKDGTYQELSQEIENKRSEIIQMAQDYASKKMAMNIIYETLRHGLDNPLKEMNEIANNIFKKLSNERYSQIKMNKHSIRVRQFSDIIFQPHELSQGTLEQLYVALRIAFIISAQTMIKMPIIIDDAFVNFDEGRREKMYEVLKEVAGDIQILFFTFDQVAYESFSSEHIIELEQYSSNENPTPKFEN